MNLTREDAIVCSDIFKNHFENITNIEEYMRDQKLESLESMTSSLFSPEDDLFCDFTMHPKDMDISISEIPNSQWETLLSITSSHINKSPVGKNIQLVAIEQNTQKIIGFIRLGSPMIYMKPRNDMLGQVFSQNQNTSKRFNSSVMMGFVIVPTQPFGYNYLGGKLLSLMCTSHEVREMCNKKYGMNLCLFETTSLYGSTKSVSQYDGLKPFVRYKGLTDSDNIPMMHGEPYLKLKSYVESKVGDILEGDTKTTSRKLRTYNKIVALIKSALKGTSEFDDFMKTIDHAKNLTEQKRYYTSDYGYSNVVDYLACKTDELIPGENYEKHNLQNIIECWRKKASNRYETLVQEGKLRTELEVWTSGKHIDIIR